MQKDTSPYNSKTEVNSEDSCSTPEHSDYRERVAWRGMGGCYRRLRSLEEESWRANQSSRVLQGLSSTPGGPPSPWFALLAQLLLASTPITGCLSDWNIAHSSLHCHICHLQREGSVFRGERENSVSVARKNGMQWRRKLHYLVSAEPGSSIFLFRLSVSNSASSCHHLSKGKRTPGHVLPLLIADLKEWVIKPYINLTT